jgi:hypothetical protein
MHPGQQRIVGDHPEVGNTVGRVVHRDRMETYRSTVPVQPYHDIGIEVHVPADVRMTGDGECRRDGINSKAAHRIRNGE